MAIKEGWTGRVYEDFEVGDIYVHPLGRTVLSVDNSWFTLLTQNMNPIHFDHAYAAQTEFGKPLVDSTFTLALVTGQSTIDLSFNVMANLGWDEVRLPNPLFEGDTVYSRSEVLEKRESKSRPNVGIVKVKTTGFKQDGVVVIEFLRTFMVYKRGQVPATARTRIPTREVDARSGTFDVAILRDTVARLIVEANYNIPSDILDALRAAIVREESPLGRRTLEQLVRNYEVAAAERVPVCQDSGVAVVFLEIGQDVHLIGGSLQDALHAGIRDGTKERLSAAIGDRRSDAPAEDGLGPVRSGRAAL